MYEPFEDEVMVPASELGDQLTRWTYRGGYDGPDDSAPTGGDTGSMGILDFRAYRSCDSDNLPVYVEIPYVAYGNYSGGTVEHSNQRVIQETYSDFTVLVRGDYSSSTLLIPLDSDIPESLVSLIRGLADYPCLDEDDLAHLESDLERECWENYGLADFRRELEREHGLDVDDVPDERLTALFADLAQHADESPYFETGESCVWPFWDDAVATAAGIIIGERIS